MESDLLDLTQLSSTYPGSSSDEIVREHLIHQIYSAFSKERKVILIEGSLGVGKTTFLSQFAKRYASKSLTFFIGSDYLSSNLYRYLYDMCFQMVNYLGEHLSIDNSANEQALLFYYNQLFSKIVRRVRRTNDHIYFIIDGLDKIQTSLNQDNILKYLPTNPPDGVYLLGSTIANCKYEFDYWSYPLPMFSKEETIRYFIDVNIDSREIDRIYNLCHGMPGFLLHIKRALINGKSLEEIIGNIDSGEIGELLESEWKKADFKSEDELLILATIAFAPEDLNIEKINAITSFSKEYISKVLHNNFIKVDSYESPILFLTDAHKSFVSKKIQRLKPNSIQLLAKYYERQEDDIERYTHLPNLYKTTGQYDSLIALLDTKAVVERIEVFRSTSLLCRNFRILAEMAIQREDWQRLIWAGLADGILLDVITSAPAISNQIEALLSLGNYDEALKLASACLLPEDRLELLGMICNKMVEDGITIPESIVQIIENEVDLIDKSQQTNQKFINKILDISANLITIKPGLATKLLEQISNNLSIDDSSDHLMDLIFMRVMAKTNDNFESISDMKPNINHDQIRQLSKAAPLPASDKEVNYILDEIEKISDISIQIFLLQSWCNMNFENTQAYRVIDRAIDILINSSNFTPTHQQLRHLIRPLLFCENVEIVKRIIDKIDIIKETALKIPADEYIRLELALSNIENKFQIKTASDRLYELYFNLENEDELDVKCLGYVRLLRSLQQNFPEELFLREEIDNKLPKYLELLISQSADHYTIMKRILTALCLHDFNLSLKFATMLNIIDRRESAIALILRSYTEDADVIDFNNITIALNLITNGIFKEWVIIQVIGNLSKRNYKTELNNKIQFINLVEGIESSVGKTYGMLYLILWIKNDDNKILSELFQKLINVFNTIDTPLNKVNTGFFIVSRIASFNKDYAKDIYNLTIKEKNQNVFAEERLYNLYIELCNTLIRMIPDIIHSLDYEQKLVTIKKIIGFIPSKKDQCILLCQLALRTYLTGNNSYNEIANKCLVLLDQISIEEEVIEAIIELSPLLYKLNRELFLEKIEKLSDKFHDLSIIRVIAFIMGKCIPSDIVNLKEMQCKVDYSTANEICFLISQLRIDCFIYEAISLLVNGLIEKKANGFRSVLIEKHSLAIATNLMEIIHKKLPDKKNITHLGYEIISKACICKLRDAVENSNQHRAIEIWKNLCPSWDELIKSGRSISNTADRVFVLSILGKMYGESQGRGKAILEEAEKDLSAIPTRVDRADRLYTIADSYYQISELEASKFLINQSIEVAQIAEQEKGKDFIVESIVELAYNIDPIFASSIATQIDNIGKRAFASRKVDCLHFKNHPASINSCDFSRSMKVVNQVCENALSSLCANRGIVMHERDIAKWFFVAMNQDFQCMNSAANWFIENVIRGRKGRTNEPLLDKLFHELVILIDMITRLNLSISNGTLSTSEYSTTLNEISNIFSFSIGEQKQAINLISNWINENCKSYIKIYDGYFSANELFILKYIPQNIRVTIITQSTLDNLNSLEEIYKNYWQSICGQSCPETQIIIYATKSGRTPIHSRYIITDNSGLELSVSLNGLCKRDTTIRILSYDEKSKIEKEIIDSIILYPPYEHYGERLTKFTFNIGI